MPIIKKYIFIILLLCTPLSISCSRFLGAIEEEIEGDIINIGRDPIAGPGTPFVDVDDPVSSTPEDSFEISGLIPSQGPIEGDTPVEIVGIFPYSSDMEVSIFFDESPALDVVVHQSFDNPDESYSITLKTPPHEEGFINVSIWIDDKVGNADFKYYIPLEIISITPDSGPSTGGTVVNIFGEGLSEDTEVFFANYNHSPYTLFEYGHLILTTLPMEPGVYSIKLQDQNTSSILVAAFTVYDQVRIIDVDPASGPLNGGTDIQVMGTGLLESTELTLANETPLNISSINSQNTIIDSQTNTYDTEGSVPVKVSNENGTWVLENGFIFYDESDTTPRIIGVVPNTSLIEGGRNFTIVTFGLADTESQAQVYFDDTPVDCQVQDQYTMLCVSPPHEEDLVDLKVMNGDVEIITEDIFNYVDLKVDVALPDMGSIAGGTYVRIFGKGFSQNTIALFDGRSARDFFISPDGTELHLRTPIGNEGTSDVTLIVDGIEFDAPQLFTYFDSSNPTEITPVDGSVNITVLSEGLPLGFAYVILGDFKDMMYPHRSGYTNALGQITFSDLELFGPQNIHAGKAGYEIYSWLGVNERDVSITLNKKLAAPPGDPATPPCEEISFFIPPRVNGRVSRIKDKYNTGDDQVIITTTRSYLGEELPEPGYLSSLTSQGDYELYTRDGNIRIVALAGNLVGESLDLHGIGLSEPLNTEGTITVPIGCRNANASNCVDDFDCASNGVCEYVNSPLQPPLKGCENDNICRDYTDCLPSCNEGVCPDGNECINDDYCLPLCNANFCPDGNECSSDQDCFPTCTEYTQYKVCVNEYDMDVLIDTPVDNMMQITLDNPPIAQDTLDDTADYSLAFAWYDFGNAGVFSMGDYVPGFSYAYELGATNLFIPTPTELKGNLQNTPFHVYGAAYNLYFGYFNVPYSVNYKFGLTDPTETILMTPMVKTLHVESISIGEHTSEFRLKFLTNNIPDIMSSANFTGVYHLIPTIPPQRVYDWITLSPGHITSHHRPVFPQETNINLDLLSGPYQFELKSYILPGSIFTTQNAFNIIGYSQSFSVNDYRLAQ